MQTSHPERSEKDIAVAVWLWPLSQTPERLAAFRGVLAEDEIALAMRISSNRHRNEYIAGRGQMRLLLAEATGASASELVFDYGPSGKPGLAGGPHFNLSHSGDLACLAICDDAFVGIDIERLRAVDPKLMNRFFSAAERVELAEAYDAWPQGFLRCWTRKEAVVKALGCGLGRDPRSFSVATGLPVAPNAALTVANIETTADEDDAWRIFHLDLPEGYVGALAVRSAKRPVRITVTRL